MKNILIVGVGGQGTLLSSKILGRLALSAGYDVKVSEVHGMAQRGGSVVTHVRYGEKVYSPLIEESGAEIILGFERLETLRWMPYLAEGGTVIYNDKPIMPMPVIMGSAAYPGDANEKIRAGCGRCIAIDALKIALECGDGRAINTVLLGVLARELEFTADQWMKAFDDCIRERFIELNKNAFEMGYNIKND